MHHIAKLKNGITSIVVPAKEAKSITILAMFPIGSRYETKDVSGAAHFVEHMMFKGTVKRPEAIDISRDLEAAGADYNAFTNKDYTGYYVKIDAKKQELAFDLLSDMIYHSVLKQEEVEKEKGAIVEEIRMYQDNPTMGVDMLLDEALFGNTPLGWNIAGTEQTVRGISRSALWKFYQAHYSPKNMVLAVAGAVDGKKMKKFLNYFVDQKAPPEANAFAFYKKGFAEFVWPEKALSLEDRVKVTEKKIDQAHVMLGFPGIPNNHPDRFALSLLLNILGVGMSSRLFVEVREKRGLAYMVRAGSGSYRDVGLCYIQAGLDPARLPEALKVIDTELARLVKEPVTKEEITNAKTSIAGRLALSWEDSSTQAEWFAKEFLFGKKIETPDEIVKKINKVTIAQIHTMAKKIFQRDAMRVAAIGPVTREQVLNIIPR